jgi:hypothetical protein
LGGPSGLAGGDVDRTDAAGDRADAKPATAVLDNVLKVLLDLVPVDHAAQRATSQRPGRHGKAKAKP